MTNPSESDLHINGSADHEPSPIMPTANDRHSAAAPSHNQLAGDALRPDAGEHGRTPASVEQTKPSGAADNVVPLMGHGAGQEAGDLGDSDPDSCEIDRVIGIAQAFIGMSIPSTDSVKPPAPPPADSRFFTDPAAVFREKNPHAAAAISAEPDIELLIDKTIPNLQRQETRRLGRIAETEVVPEDAGKQSWTLLKRLYAASLWVTWIGLAGVSVYFIEDYILAARPGLQLDDAGYMKALIPALCIPLLSSAIALGAKHSEEPAQKQWVNILLWIGAPLLMVGLIPLLGTTIPGAAPSYEGRFAANSAAPLISEETWRQLWLGARLIGELLVATACRMGIDLFFNKHKPRRPNKKYVTRKQKLETLTKLVTPLQEALLKINALTNKYGGWEDQYWAMVANTRSRVMGVRVTHVGRR